MGGCSQYIEKKCFISAYDAQTGKQLWRFSTIARDGEEGGDTWGALTNLFRAGGETWITGSYDPELNLTFWGTGAGQAVDAGQPRNEGDLTRGSSPVRRSRSMRIPASSPGISSTRPARRSISTSCSNACSWTPTTRSILFTVGKDGILWKLDRKTGQILSVTFETVFQNAWDHINPEDRGAAVPSGSLRDRRRAVGPELPEQRGWTQLAGDELQPARPTR
jgi:alcohol dehydrogenase (cytochrome c)